MSDRYAVSYISFFDNELDTVFVYANSVAEAVKKAMPKLKCEIDWGDRETLEEFKSLAFDCDAMIHVVQVP